MSSPRRFLNVLIAVLMIAGAVYITVFPTSGYYLILIIISIGLVVRGVSSFVYYATLAKHMVGGRKEVFKGLIFLDLGLYLLSQANMPVNAVMSYVGILFGISGVIALIRSVELKKAGAGAWKIKLAIAMFQFAMIILGNIFSQSMYALAWIYGLYLVVKAAERIYYSLKKTDLVYTV